MLGPLIGVALRFDRQMIHNVPLNAPTSDGLSMLRRGGFHMSGIRRFLLVCAILTLPAIGYAQEAVLNGTVTDSTGGALPGVMVTATNQATGNTFVAVTDGSGRYRIPVRTGTYKVATELSGFGTVTRTNIEVLLGQTVTIDVPMAPSGVAETVNVTGESPLVNTTSSTLGGNVDPKQVAELPVSGRNFMALAMLAPGARVSSTNASQPLPDRGRAGDVREFQLNLDGQQVTRDMGTGTQPRYSQDMIEEFQYISNRFDATMGRSSGVLVNIISKSGTNELRGVGRLNYRSSKFNAQEPVLKAVQKIDNLQISTAVGGPIKKDKLHYFGNFEYEREPTQSTWNTPYPAFNITLNGKAWQKKGGGRIDWQPSQNMRLMGKQSKSKWWVPFGTGSSNSHPSSTSNSLEYNTESYLRFTHVLSNRAVNEIEGGRAVYGLQQAALTNWTNNWLAPVGITTGSPRIRFRGFTFTPNQNLPRHQDQWYYSIRDNFTFSYDAKGRHDLRTGGEFLQRNHIQANRRFGTGELDCRGSNPPANIQTLFPDAFNVDTWNLAAISPFCGTYLIGVGDFNNWVHSKKVGAWAQDDWRMSERLTLNLGLRWDYEIGAFAEVTLLPWETPGKPGAYNDKTNFQPRLGFAYKVGDRMVIRGGAGLYVAGATSGEETQAKGNVQISLIRYSNPTPGVPSDFAANPTGGKPLPTFDQVQPLFCHNNNSAPGCVRQDAIEVILDPKYEKLGRTVQTSIGMQRQIGDVAAVEVDYIYSHGTREKGNVDNINMTYNPATGANYPFTTISQRFDPAWGVVTASVHMGRSTVQELRTTFTKRFSQHWQASGTYSLKYFWDAEPPPFSGPNPVPFATAIDMGGEWSLAEGDQRHRATLSGIWEVGHGLQVSAIHYVGSGIRQETVYGGDPRVTQGNEIVPRLRPDGTIVPRNSMTAPRQNRTDLRLQQGIPLHGRIKIDGIAEVFNLFNQPNWSIDTVESDALYLKHTAGQYRTAQVGFRLSF